MYFYLILRKDFWVGLGKETVFAFKLLFCLEFKSWFSNTDFPKNFLVSFSLSMLEIPWNHQWSYFIGLGMKSWRSSWEILAMHRKKLKKCPFFLWLWCRTTPALVIQSLLPPIVLWQERLHPSPAVSFPSCSSPLLPRRTEGLFHLWSWANEYPTSCSLKMRFSLSSWQLLSVACREMFKNPTNNRFQLLTSTVLRNYVISLILAIP